MMSVNDLRSNFSFILYCLKYNFQCHQSSVSELLPMVLLTFMFVFVRFCTNSASVGRSFNFMHSSFPFKLCESFLQLVCRLPRHYAIQRGILLADMNDQKDIFARHWSNLLAIKILIKFFSETSEIQSRGFIFRDETV